MKNSIILNCLILLLLSACSKSSVNNQISKQNNGGSGSDTTAASVSYRPLFHYTPTTNWVNDPNGLVYYNGQYHLFSQYNPLGYVWGNMNWDQALSSDFFSWHETGVAIPEVITGIGTSLIFSGSAVVDNSNTSGFATQAGQVPLVAVYTANNSDASGNAISQTQCVSYSMDQGQTWIAYAKNPVLNIGSTQFRDPKVFWYAPTQTWVMVISKPDVDSVRIYNSPDLKKWTFKSDFGAIGNTNQVWECPDLYQLTVEGTSTQKWVLSVSGGGVENGFGGMQYFIGSFDGTKFTADADNYPLYVDYGKDYYAGVTYNNIPTTDGRTVMVGWANNWSYAGSIPTMGYRGQYAVPRSLSLRKVNNSDGYHLLQVPVAEIGQHEAALYNNSAISLSNTMQLSAASGTSLDIQFTVSLANAATAGINILQSGSEQTTITLNKALSSVLLDRTKSGNTSFSSSFTGIESAKMDNVDLTNITCRILVDKSIIEVFINQGEYTITDLVFPTQAKGAVSLFATGGTADFTNLTVKQVSKTIH
ncbi:glycoside hydrolase family 32 protein [Mucilaginibacter sp.]